MTTLAWNLKTVVVTLFPKPCVKHKSLTAVINSFSLKRFWKHQHTLRQGKLDFHLLATPLRLLFA